MIDTLKQQLPKARALHASRNLGLEDQPYVLVTLHRPSNVDTREALEPILFALATVNKVARVVFPIHPRTRKNAESFGLGNLLRELLILEPAGYLQMLSLTDGADVVMTDSGGLQEETTVLGVPCVTLREKTERPITLMEGTNRMAPWPLSQIGIVESFRAALGQGRLAVGACSPEGWDGSASKRIVDALMARSA
jgi:UDP-N-acetylglucosamine 2-epimerase (non-hydrolysing)